MSNKVLFIGFGDCKHSNTAVNFLISKGYDTTFWKASKKRGERPPSDILTWNGDYIFHFKSYCILPEKLLKNASIAAINFHPSPPKYPGSGGINWALYNGETSTGVTVHYMNEKIDNGPIIQVHNIEIRDDDNVGTLIDKIHKCQFDAFIHTICTISSQGYKEIVNMASKNTNQWAPKTGRISDIDKLEQINLNISKKELDKRVRSTYYNGYGPHIKLHGHTFKFTGE